VLSAHGSAVLRARHAGHLLALTCRVAVEQGHFHAAMIFRPEGNRLKPVHRFGDERVLDYIESLGPMEVLVPETGNAERQVCFSGH
jgi:hypothetical protein